MVTEKASNMQISMSRKPLDDKVSLFILNLFKNNHHLGKLENLNVAKIMY